MANQIEVNNRLIDELQGAVATKIVKDDAGTEYSTRQLFHLPEKILPSPEPVTVGTLSSFAEYVKNFSREGRGIRLIHIESPRKVWAYSGLYGGSYQRDTPILASTVPFFEEFTFGTYCQIEQMVIALQTMFVPGADTNALLKVVGNIKEEDVRETNDNGVSQSVVGRSGVVTKAEIQVPSPVVLRPYRTFREIEQPASPFVVRIKRVAGTLPQVALMEADGGKWKLLAMAGILKVLGTSLMVMDSADRPPILA